MNAANKYKARKTLVDGILFDSAKEANRYLDLKLMEKCGRIHSLERQPRFDMVINGKKCGFYKADFRYVEDGQTITEDVKGMRTPVYKLKKKIVEALYGVEIVEI